MLLYDILQNVNIETTSNQAALFWCATPFLAIEWWGADCRSRLVTIVHDASELTVELSPSKAARKRGSSMAVHVNDIYALAMLGIRSHKTMCLTSCSISSPNNVQPRGIAGEIACGAIGRVIGTADIRAHHHP